MDELKEVRFANNPRTSTDYPDTCGGWNLEGTVERAKTGQVNKFKFNLKIV